MAGESSSTAVHWRIEKNSPQRNIATRIADRDVDFLAVGFLDVAAWIVDSGHSEDVAAVVVEVGSVAVVEVEEEEEEDGVEWSPETLPVVMSSHLGDLPRCFMNECCLSCSLNTHRTHNK